MKNLYRHKIVAVIEFERTYDPKNPLSFHECLEEINSTRKALVELGCTLRVDDGKPCTVRE